jgi:hypothetical protein
MLRRAVLVMVVPTLSPLVRLPPLAATADTLAPWLGPAEAAEAMTALAEAMDRPASPTVLAAQAGALAALGPRVEDAEARRQAAPAARRLREALQATADPGPITSLSVVLRPLAPRLAGEDSAAAARAAVEAMGRTADPNAVAALTDTLAALVPQRLDEARLVELLKMPTCRRGARAVILRELGRLCGGEFHDVWEFADWASRHRTDLDLTTPPTRSTGP